MSHHAFFFDTEIMMWSQSVHKSTIYRNIYWQYQLEYLVYDDYK